MDLPPPDRPRYSTGFRLFLAGWVSLGLGVLCATKVSKPLGLALMCVGGFPAVWYRWPSDWRRTWPEDFPILSRLAGARTERSRFSDSVYEEQRRIWHRQPARVRLWGSACALVGTVAFLAWAVVDPATYFSANTVRQAGFLLIAPFLAFFSVREMRRALRDRRGG
jgi:hypothetical protein